MRFDDELCSSAFWSSSPSGCYASKKLKAWAKVHDFLVRIVGQSAWFPSRSDITSCFQSIANFAPNFRILRSILVHHHTTRSTQEEGPSPGKPTTGTGTSKDEWSKLIIAAYSWYILFLQNGECNLICFLPRIYKPYYTIGGLCGLSPHPPFPIDC